MGSNGQRRVRVRMVGPAGAPPVERWGAGGWPAPAPVADAAAAQRGHELLARERSKLEDHLRTARVSHGDESAPAEARAEKGGDGKKVGRNDPCPCGSGRKYKNCHGRQ